MTDSPSTLNPLSIPQLLGEADQCSREGQWRDAIVLVQRVLDTVPEHTLALRKMAAFLYNAMQYECALPYLVKVLEQETDPPTKASLFNPMIMAACSAMQFELAARYACQAMGLKLGIAMPEPPTVATPLQPFHHYLMAQIYLAIDKSKLKNAEKLCQQILKADPTHASALVLKDYLGLRLNTLVEQAKACHSQGDLNTATTQYGNLLYQDPGNPEGIHGLGLLLWQQGHHDRALHMVQLSIQCAPQTAHFHVNLGNIFAAQNQPDAAIAAWQKALQLDPQFYEAHESLGQLYIQLQQPHAALPHYQFMVQVQSQNPTHHHTVGNLYREVGQFDQALNHYQRAIALNPQYVLAYFNLANLYFNLGQKADAKACLLKITQLEPGFEPARQILTNWQD